jgi:hypothetical protein
MNPTDVVNQFVQLVGQRAPILEPFTSSAKAQIHLLNTIQVYCHEETRLLTAFPQLVKVLYNADCLEDQAIIYWFDKGAKPNGKQHFLKVTKPLVDFLREQSDDEDDE